MILPSNLNGIIQTIYVKKKLLKTLITFIIILVRRKYTLLQMIFINN